MLIAVRRYRCTGCGHVWRQDTSKAAEPRAKISRAGLAWALVALVVQHLTVARIAEGLAVAWDTANDAVLAEGKRVLIEDPGRFDGVAVIGVDEHAWRHTRRGDKSRRGVSASDWDTDVAEQSGNLPLPILYHAASSVRGSQGVRVPIVIRVDPPGRWGLFEPDRARRSFAVRWEDP